MGDKFDEVTEDIQKFRKALRYIGAANPTGVTEDELISMSIAKHLRKYKKMTCDARPYLR